MTHFAVLVIGDDVETQLERYNENTEVDPYQRDDWEWRTELAQAREWDTDRRNPRAGRFDDADDLTILRDWSGGGVEPDGSGGYRNMTTYNPDSAWDWWVVGGRFRGRLQVRPDASPADYTLTPRHWTDREPDGPLDADSALIRALDPESLVDAAAGTYAVVKDGEWHRRGRVGWFGVTVDEHQEEEWRTLVEGHLAGLPDDTRLTVVDCHI